VLGRRVGLVIYAALLVGAFVFVVVAVALGWLPLTALLPLVVAPMPVKLVRLYLSTSEPRPLNAGVRGSAALHARFGLLFALGIALGPLIGWQVPAL
jgi:1,4-dihydroxy-2-naphthoate octaprenyltransferase